MFQVTVTSVATHIVKGKTKRVGVRRVEKNESYIKRATVTLKKGDKISLFEPAEEGKKKK
jgi:ribosomal protein L23